MHGVRAIVRSTAKHVFGVTRDRYPNVARTLTSIKSNRHVRCRPRLAPRISPPSNLSLKVWESYTAATKLLLRPGGAGLVLCTTISENAPFMKELLGASPCEFKPSIPNLVYQYSLYVNYDSKRLGAANPELPSEA